MSAPQKQFKRAKNSDAPEVTAKYYLTNAKLLPAVIEAKKQNKITDELARMLMLLVKKYASQWRFAGYSFKEDMESEALINLCQNALKFNPEQSSNPFAYYTTSITRSFYQVLNVEKKHRRIRDEMLIEIGENPSYNFRDETNNASGEDKQILTDMESEMIEAKERIKADEELKILKALEGKDESEVLLTEIDNLKSLLEFD